MHRLLEMTEKELFAAIELFTEKLSVLGDAPELDELESQWLRMLQRVHSKFKGKIGRDKSFLMSWGEICLALFDEESDFKKASGLQGLEAACAKAHRKALMPPRQYERKHVFIDAGNEEDQPIAPVEPDDDAVMRALEALSPDDNALLREFYIGERSVKDLAGEGVREDAMRQRIHRAKTKFKRFYKGTDDDDSRVPANPDGHAAKDGEDFHESVGFSRDDAGRDCGPLRLHTTAC